MLGSSGNGHGRCCRIYVDETRKLKSSRCETLPSASREAAVVAGVFDFERLDADAQR